MAQLIYHRAGLSLHELQLQRQRPATSACRRRLESLPILLESWGTATEPHWAMKMPHV
jgi:hypothetical protein